MIWILIWILKNKTLINRRTLLYILPKNEMAFSLPAVKKNLNFFLFLIFELIKKHLKKEDSFQRKVLKGKQFQMLFLEVSDSFKKFGSD